MPKYRSKPVVVEAWHCVDGAEMPDWIVQAMRDDNLKLIRLMDLGSVYDRFHGWIFFRIGDWIIRGAEGELYPCRDEVFRKKYEALDD